MWEAFLFCLVFGRTVWDGANYRRARLEVRLVFASASLSAPSSSFFRRLKLVMKRELNQWTCSWCCSIENIASVTRKWFLSVFFFVFFFFLRCICVSLGLHCCTQAFSSCDERGYSLLWHTGFWLQWLLLLQSTGSRCVGFSSCGTWAE